MDKKLVDFFVESNLQRNINKFIHLLPCNIWPFSLLYYTYNFINIDWPFINKLNVYCICAKISYILVYIRCSSQITFNFIVPLTESLKSALNYMKCWIFREYLCHFHGNKYLIAFVKKNIWEPDYTVLLLNLLLRLLK